jgi:hypothetical protein
VGTCDLTTLVKRYAGDNQDNMSAMVMDSNKNIYIVGTSYSTGLQNGKSDGIILKTDASANKIWAKHFGNALEEQFKDVAVDTTSVFVVGETNYPNAGTIPTPPITSRYGQQDLFILKITGANGALERSVSLGGDKADTATSVEIDTGSGVYIAGHSASTGFKTGIVDFLIVKLKQSDLTTVWTKYYGLTETSNLNDLVIYNSMLFLVGNSKVSQAARVDFIIGKVTSSSGEMQNFWHFGGVDDEESSAIAVDTSGFLYITGTSNSYSPVSSRLSFADKDCFTFKFNPNSGGVGVWGRYFGSGVSEANVQINDIVVNAGSVYVVGSGRLETSFGMLDIVMARFDAESGLRRFLVHIGGETDDIGMAMTVLGSGKVLLGGYSTST